MKNCCILHGLVYIMQYLLHYNKGVGCIKTATDNLAGVLRAVYAARFLFCSSLIRNEVAMAIYSFHLLIMGKV